MANPPTLTPEQRQLALEKAAVARRSASGGEGQAEDRLAHLVASCSTRPTRKDESGEMLAKLKVVSVLESLPGVGKVRARNIMSELDISESRRLRGLGTNQRRGAAREVWVLTPDRPDDPRRSRPRRPARPRGHVRRGQGNGRRPAAGDAIRRSVVGVVDHAAAAVPAKSRASTTTS